jgi:hypothetical protein
MLAWKQPCRTGLQDRQFKEVKLNRGIPVELLSFQFRGSICSTKPSHCGCVICATKLGTETRASKRV